MEPRFHHRDFHFEGLGVRVSAGAPGHLDWLEEFLSPQLSVEGGGPCRFHVRFIADNAAYTETLARGPAGGEADVFALDSSVVRLQFWNDPEGRTTFHDERFFTFYRVEGDLPVITILARTDHIRGRTPMMRVIRELAMNHGRRVGGFFIHGSSFAVGGAGVILAGPKHSGKTTLLIHLLKNAGADYLANDRVMVRMEEGGVRFRGIPSIVTIREPTMALFPDLRERLLSGGFHFRKSRSETEAARGPVTQPWANGKYGLNPDQFCRVLGARPIGSSTGRAIVFPRLCGDSSGITLEEIDAADAAARLRGALFGIDGLRKRSEVFVSGDGEAAGGPPSLEVLCRRFTDSVRCFTCRLGAGAYKEEDSARRFIDRVIGAVTEDRS